MKTLLGITLCGMASLFQTAPSVAANWASKAPGVPGEYLSLQTTNSWRAVGTDCGTNRYEVAIWTGRTLDKALRDVRINGQSQMGFLLPALKPWAGVDARTTQVSIFGCELNRVKVALHAIMLPERREEHLFEFWLTRGGEIELITRA